MNFIGYKNINVGSICNIIVSGMVFLCTSSLTHAQNNSRNLITNPSFENDHKGWQQVEPVSISDHFRSGSKSSKISGKAGIIRQTVEVTPNTDYILEGYIKGYGRMGVKVKRKKFKDQVIGASDWVKSMVEFNSGSTSSVEVYASFYKEQGRFDDFKLTPKFSNRKPTTTAQPYSTQPTPNRLSSTSSPVCPSMGYLPITSVFDNGNDGNMPENAIDGDLTNRWSSRGLGKTITFNLSRISEVRELSVMWYKGFERVILFSVETSVDGKKWTKVLTDASSTPTDGFEKYDIENLFNPEAKMVRIIGGGNSLHDWNSIVELRIKGCVN